VAAEISSSSSIPSPKLPTYSTLPFTPKTCSEVRNNDYSKTCLLIKSNLQVRSKEQQEKINTAWPDAQVVLGDLDDVETLIDEASKANVVLSKLRSLLSFLNLLRL
jgi:hypothetical protein